MDKRPYGINRVWHVILGIAIRDRHYLIKEKRKLQTKLAKARNRIRNDPEIDWYDKWHIEDLEQELFEITKELESHCA